MPALPPAAVEPTVTLRSLEQDQGSSLTVADRIARSDARLRIWVAIAVVVTFLCVNGAVLLGIWFAFQHDIAMLAISNGSFLAKDRLVTTELLMTLVGATTVQLGGLIVLIGKYIFPAAAR